MIISKQIWRYASEDAFLLGCDWYYISPPKIRLAIRDLQLKPLLKKTLQLETRITDIRRELD